MSDVELQGTLNSFSIRAKWSSNEEKQQKHASNRLLKLANLPRE
jgi:hypothetical protein